MKRREFNLSLMAALPAAGSSTSRVRLPTASNQAAPLLKINGGRLNERLKALARFGGTAAGGTHRSAYSDADLQARQYTMKLMTDARLEVRIDAAGNIVGRREGTAPAAKPLVIGSHIDSVPDGGSYDGQVGAMGAVEVATTLTENGTLLRHPLEVIIFQNEEGGTIGSAALTRGLSEKQLGLLSSSGKTIRDGIRFIGGDPDRLASVVRAKGDVAAFLELHIEQGGILNSEGTNIGVVEGIVGVYWWEVTITGAANHAGTTPMNQRRDALLAAARYVEAVNRVVTSIPGRQVGTVGRIQAFPGAPNVVPGKVVTSLDLRDLDASKVQRIFGRIRSEVSQIETATGTSFDFRQTNDTSPAPTDPRIRQAIVESARGLNLTTRELPSGAGHDAQEMAALSPIGMIFIPSRDGISHSPREFSSPGDIANGANVMLQTLIRMDGLFV